MRATVRRVLLLVWAARADVGWPALGPVLRCGDDAAFARLVAPLSVAVNLSYVATWGSYYDSRARDGTPGAAWTKAALEANPRGGGMRALAWLHADGAGLTSERTTVLTETSDCAGVTSGAGALQAAAIGVARSGGGR